MRLQEDVTQMQGAISLIMERGGGRREGTLRAFRALESCDETLAAPDDFQRTFAEYQNQQTAAIIVRTAGRIDSLVARLERHLARRAAP